MQKVRCGFKKPALAGFADLATTARCMNFIADAVQFSKGLLRKHWSRMVQAILLECR